MCVFCLFVCLFLVDQELLDTFFSRLMNKLNDEANSSIRPLLLDVAAALSRGLRQPSLVHLLHYISPLLDVRYSYSVVIELLSRHSNRV